jgi:hypothetical protein
MATWGKILQKVKDPRMDHERRRDPLPVPGRVAQPQEEGRANISNRVLDVPSQPCAHHFLGRQQGQDGKQARVSTAR